MKKILVLFAVVLISGCATKAPFSPPAAMLYSDYKAPLSTEFNNTDLGTKTGEAHSVNVLGLVSTGDVSIKTAAMNGRITKIKHVDYSHFNLIIYQKTTVIVYGD